jgi:hypothetical protein
VQVTQMPCEGSQTGVAPVQLSCEQALATQLPPATEVSQISLWEQPSSTVQVTHVLVSASQIGVGAEQLGLARHCTHWPPVTVVSQTDGTLQPVDAVHTLQVWLVPSQTDAARLHAG